MGLKVPDSYQNELLQLAQSLYQCPEPGYQEHQTVDLWRLFAYSHGLTIDYALDGMAPIITCGDFSQAKTRIMITADLDAVGFASDEGLRFRHLCGHHAQSVHAFGVALLFQLGLFPAGLAIKIIGCPAEECLPACDASAPIPFVAGKQRLLKEGVFAGATAVLSTHLSDDTKTQDITLAYGANGGIWVKFTASELGMAPSDDVVDCMIQRIMGSATISRTMFEDGGEKHVRINTQRVGNRCPPDASNLIREFKAHGYVAHLIADYAPLFHDVRLRKMAKRTLTKHHPSVGIRDALWLPGMTDLGDVSCCFPTLQVFIGGTTGVTHEDSFSVVDPMFAYIWPIHFVSDLICEIHQTWEEG